MYRQVFAPRCSVTHCRETQHSPICFTADKQTQIGLQEHWHMQPIDNPSPELQREVQRLMGRCLLRLQQYERLMKAMLVHH